MTFRVMSRGELKEEVLSFNNTAFLRMEGGWLYFRATPFAVRGISKQLGRMVQRVVRDEYRIDMSNIQSNQN